MREIIVPCSKLVRRMTQHDAFRATPIHRSETERLERRRSLLLVTQCRQGARLAAGELPLLVSSRSEYRVLYSPPLEKRAPESDLQKQMEKEQDTMMPMISAFLCL